ncbi:MAG: phosphopantothenoylcysteine synthase [Planctomycetia bacterium]|nr:phosphopantothenoylcysteine synthase [Planctomycetia bacterium]
MRLSGLGKRRKGEGAQGMNVVVTGGGTIAPIDDVRSIANASSGRFSAAITEAWLRRGAAVWHVHAPSAQLPLLRAARFDPDADDPAAEHARLSALRDAWRAARDRLHLVPLRRGDVADYRETLRRVLTDRPVDVAFLAMAVSDFEPEPVPGKIDSETEALTIRARRAPKVIQSIRDWSPGVYLVGFKLLSRADPDDLIRAAESACRTNRADLTVANDLQTLREGRHAVHLVRPGFPVETLGPSPTLAEELVDRVVTLATERTRADRGGQTSGLPDRTTP